MLFSIITVNYNQSEGLKRTIESVVKQKFDEFEFIIIDGGSSDDSVDYINLYVNDIDYWVSEKDKGVYDAMNKGWQVANGKFCLFLNSGDVFYDSTVLLNVSKHIDLKADFVYGLLIWKSNGYMWNALKDFKIHEILYHTPIPHQGSFISTELLKRLGGYKVEFKIISDWGLIVDGLINKIVFQKINDIICLSDDPGISSTDAHIILNERMKYLNKYHYLIFKLSKFKLFLKKILH